MIAALVLALFMQGSDTIQAARRIAQASTLSELRCPLQDDRAFPAYFRYNASGASHAAEFAMLLPVPPEEVIEWLEDVEHYPDWLLLASDGSPNLRKLSFNPTTGRGRIAVGVVDLEGILTRRRETRSFGLRIEMIGGRRLKETVLELAATESI